MKIQFFKYSSIVTIAAVYFLILVGSVVRTTGAGMGCPDWPKCFGMWVPPTSEDQLPRNYKEVFGKDLQGEVSFNVLRTWTEYVNRLLGVLIGILIFSTFIASIFAFWSKNRAVVYLSFIAFILVGFQGWLGSRVVATELLPWMVTTHLLVAVIIVIVLIWALVRARVIWVNPDASDPTLGFAALFLFALSLGQFVLGTRVREAVDYLSRQGVLRAEWIDKISVIVYIHGISAIVLLLIHYFMIRKLKRNSNGSIVALLNTLWYLVLFSVLSGSVLACFNMMAVAQPLHLTLASLILGTQFTIYLVNNKGLIN